MQQSTCGSAPAGEAAVEMDVVHHHRAICAGVSLSWRRSVADSTVAYQGYGRGLDTGLLDRLNAAAVGGVWPDRTILLADHTKFSQTAFVHSFDFDRIQTIVTDEPVSSGWRTLLEKKHIDLLD